MQNASAKLVQRDSYEEHNTRHVTCHVFEERDSKGRRFGIDVCTWVQVVTDDPYLADERGHYPETDRPAGRYFAVRAHVTRDCHAYGALSRTSLFKTEWMRLRYIEGRIAAARARALKG